jgi:hypothetical protein
VVDVQGNTVNGKARQQEDSHSLPALRKARISRQEEGLRIVRLWRDREDETLQLGETALED